MGPRASRSQTSNTLNDINGLPRGKFFPHAPSDPATIEDKRSWNGFCEIESEPVRISDDPCCS